MFEIKNFDDWIADEESGKFGSGASEKIWLVNPNTGEKGIFKFPKIKSDGSITGEYYAEKIASELGSLLGIKCANVDIGFYGGRIGCMSYNFISDNEILNEGINFIQEKYPYYDRNKFFDDVVNIKYSVQMMEKINVEINDILKMIIFDVLIGNSDRHHSNWGYIYRFSPDKDLFCFFSPLYDNGSSLCSYVNKEQINDILKDKTRYNALIDTKSKSCIGWLDKRPIRHFDLLENIYINYYKNTIGFVKLINKKITIESIENIINKFNNNIISNEMKKLLIKYIIDRKNKIIEIYNLENEVVNNE